MTKHKAMVILREFIAYKKECIKIMSEDFLSTDLENIRQRMVRLAQSDQNTLEKILKELTTKKESRK